MAVVKSSAATEVVRTPYNKKAKKAYTLAVGRRREAVARVRLHKETIMWEGNEIKAGDVYVNHKPVSDYFKDSHVTAAIADIFKSTNTTTKYGFTIKVSGGGMRGQLNAVLHGIANVLVSTDENHRPLLKKKGLLTRDARVRQRRKVGMGGKSRRQKQSPKR